MLISVIFWDAAFREHTHTIDIFAAQKFSYGDFEIIWVDFYNSSRGVEQKVNIYENVRLIKLQNPSSQPWHLGKCVNAGVKVSSGDLLIIPDGDIAAEHDFLDHVWIQHQRVQDLVLYYKRFDEPQEVSCEISRTSLLHLKDKSKLTNGTNYGGCLTLRRQTFNDIGGYVEHSAFSNAGTNGLETYTRLRNYGAPIRWAHDKFIYHPWHQNTSTPHEKNNLNILRFMALQYNWIIPHAGLEQSWIIRCRDLSLDFKADGDTCNQYLKTLPKSALRLLNRLSLVSLFTTTNFNRIFQLLKEFLEQYEIRQTVQKGKIKSKYHYKPMFKKFLLYIKKYINSLYKSIFNSSLS